ncbi:MAG: pectate lyase [Christensenellaceae bacterium]
MLKKLICYIAMLAISVATISACSGPKGTESGKDSGSVADSDVSSGEADSSVSNGGGSTSDSGSNGNAQSSLFVNFGNDVEGYADQDRLTEAYALGAFTLNPKCKFTATTGEQRLDGITFKMACQFGASSTPTSQASIAFSAKSGNKLIVYAMIGSLSAESANLKLIDSSQNEVISIVMTPAFSKYQIDLVSDGTFYLCSGDVSINVYGIDLLAGSSSLPDSSDSSGSSSSSDSGSYTEAQKAVILKADNAITWQIPDNGGWDKAYDMHISKARTTEKYNAGSGWTAKGGGYLGIIDNGATYSHMDVIAQAYQITKGEKYKKSLQNALGFLKNLQTAKGGFTQVYPKRGNYSDYVTFNDDAMVNVMQRLRTIYQNKAPYTDVFTQTERTDAKNMFDKGVDFILKSQIEINGEKSAWCAQHDPTTYEPKEAREYERPSVSGSESIGVIGLLLSLTDNQQAVEAGMAALRWFDAHKLENKAFSSAGVKNSATGEIEYIYDKNGSTIWYRFYDLNGKGFFSDRKSNSKWSSYNGYFYDITEISEERRVGYSWMGTWPQKLIAQYLK